MVLIMIFLRLLNTFNGLLEILVIYMDFGNEASFLNKEVKKRHSKL
jgi:hypothetical protein